MSGGSEIEDETVFTVDDDDPSLLDILIENVLGHAFLDILNEEQYKQAAFKHLDDKKCIFASSFRTSIREQINTIKEAPAHISELSLSRNARRRAQRKEYLLEELCAIQMCNNNTFPDSMANYLAREDLAKVADAMKDPPNSELFKGKLKPSHEGPGEQHEAKRRRVLHESHRAPAEKPHAMHSTVGQPADSEEENNHQSLALPNVGHNNVGGTPLELLGDANKNRKDQQLPSIGPASTQSSLSRFSQGRSPSAQLERQSAVGPQKEFPSGVRKRIALDQREASHSQEPQQQPQPLQEAQQLPQKRQQHLQSPYCFPVQFQVEVSKTHRDKIISISKEEEAEKLTLTTIKTHYEAAPCEKATQGPLLWADMEPLQFTPLPLENVSGRPEVVDSRKDIEFIPMTDSVLTRSQILPTAGKPDISMVKIGSYTLEPEEVARWVVGAFSNDTVDFFLSNETIAGTMVDGETLARIDLRFVDALWNFQNWSLDRLKAFCALAIGEPHLTIAQLEYLSKQYQWTANVSKGPLPRPRFPVYAPRGQLVDLDALPYSTIERSVIPWRDENDQLVGPVVTTSQLPAPTHAIIGNE